MELRFGNLTWIQQIDQKLKKFNVLDSSIWTIVNGWSLGASPKPGLRPILYARGTFSNSPFFFIEIASWKILLLHKINTPISLFVPLTSLPPRLFLTQTSPIPKDYFTSLIDWPSYRASPSFQVSLFALIEGLLHGPFLTQTSLVLKGHFTSLVDWPSYKASPSFQGLLGFPQSSPPHNTRDQ